MVKAVTTVNINLSLANGIADAAALRGVRAATIEAKSLVIAQLSQPGQGALRPGGKSRASKPGQSPAPDTGTLRGSTSSEVGAGLDGYVGRVSVNAEYAAAQELGTETIAPRPYISTVVTKYTARIIDAFAKFARV